jgi:23S rRNA (uracil1939-C5)-methyltransferase
MGVSVLDIGQIVELEVESLNYSADAVGKVDGFVVFVKGGVPGDKLLVEITRIKKNYAVAEMLEVLSPSPYRCQPPCVHFLEGCGGCQWQHIEYDHQLYWKEEIIRQALIRIGKLEDIPKIQVCGMNSPFHYRNKLRVFVAQNSSNLHFLRGEKGLRFGMRRQGSHDVVPIRGCFISDRTINSLNPVFSGKVFFNHSMISEMDIRTSVESGQIMLLCTYEQNDEEIQADIDKLATMPGVSSVLYRVGSDSFNLGYGKPYIEERVGNIKYKIEPDSFFQVNSAGLYKLIQLVREFAGKRNGVVLDAHCGVGTFALQIADLSQIVWGTDISHSAIALASVNAENNDISNARFREGTAYDIIDNELRDTEIDLVILDPPRKGCEKKDLEALTEVLTGKIIYISCNPTTFARDIKELRKAGYTLLRLAMVDMFPMTYHLELVALCGLKRNTK